MTPETHFMKILYAIQATGNGHLSRARAIIPLLKNYGQTDLLLSGSQAEIKLDYPVKYRLNGLSFTFGKTGGIDLWNTYGEASILRLIQEYESVDIANYDLIINDFEPISAWAAQLKNIPCISLSHQAALLEPAVPLAKDSDTIGRFVLRNYAPGHERIGFHFESYSPKILTPVIRPEIRCKTPKNSGHYTVYLPAWDAFELAEKLSELKGVKWQIFSKSGQYGSYNKHITIHPINSDSFSESVLNSAGVLCGAGFETPAEALFLGKKLLVVPMKNQYEQQCNALALKNLGVPVIKNLKPKQFQKIKTWIDTENAIQLNYPDNRTDALDLVFEKYQHLIKSGKHLEKKFLYPLLRKRKLA